MKKTILTVVAVAGFSLLAMGQSSMSQTEKKKPEPKPTHEVTSPRDASSGQATGRKGNYDVKKMEGAVQENTEATQARDAQTGKASGKLQNVSSDATTQAAPTPASEPKPAEHTVKSPRDASSGMATGKRQHKPVTFEKEHEPAQPQK